MFLGGEEHRNLLETAAGRPAYAPWNRLGKHLADDSFIHQHIDMVKHLQYLDVHEINRKKFTVVADCINGAGGRIVPQLLRSLGCRVIEMNCDVSGVFSRTPEPLPENLGDLCLRVQEEKADFGLAVDPDVDRLVLITEKGEPFGEEYTITSVVKFVLGRRLPAAGDIPTVVVNLSTTRAVDDVAGSFGARVVRTPVGEINVAGKMKETGALVGGEGSGGVILPAVHYGRDAVVGIGLIVQQLAEFGGTLSELKASLPQYAIAKMKVAFDDRSPKGLLDAVKARHGQNGNVNTEDGLKLNFTDSWVHLRISNTEPAIRIIAEAPTSGEARSLAEKFRSEIPSV